MNQAKKSSRPTWEQHPLMILPSSRTGSLATNVIVLLNLINQVVQVERGSTAFRWIWLKQGISVSRNLTMYVYLSNKHNLWMLLL